MNSVAVNWIIFVLFGWLCGCSKVSYSFHNTINVAEGFFFYSFSMVGISPVQQSKKNVLSHRVSITGNGALAFELWCCIEFNQFMCCSDSTFLCVNPKLKVHLQDMSGVVSKAWDYALHERDSLSLCFCILFLFTAEFLHFQLYPCCCLCDTLNVLCWCGDSELEDGIREGDACIYCWRLLIWFHFDCFWADRAYANRYVWFQTFTHLSSCPS